jgi:hypothetical protein
MNEEELDAMRQNLTLEASTCPQNVANCNPDFQTQLETTLKQSQ